MRRRFQSRPITISSQYYKLFETLRKEYELPNDTDIFDELITNIDEGSNFMKLLLVICSHNAAFSQIYENQEDIRKQFNIENVALNKNLEQLARVYHENC